MWWPTAILLVTFQVNYPMLPENEPCVLHVNGTNLNYAPLTEMTFGAFVSLPFNLTDTKALDERTTVRGTVDARLVQDFISPHEKDTAGSSSLRQPQDANTCPVPTGLVDSKNWTASFGEISADSANQGQGDVNESETVIPVQAKTDRQDYYRVYQEYAALNRSPMVKTLVVLQFTLPAAGIIYLLRRAKAQWKKLEDLEKEARGPRKKKVRWSRGAKRKSSKRRH